GRCRRASRESRLDVDWVVGAGIGVSDGAALSAPLGLIAGHTFRAEGALFTPYVSPRVVLDLLFGGDGPEDDTDADLELAGDSGLDPRLSQDFLSRFGGTLGDAAGVPLGLGLRGARRADPGGR